MDFSKVLIIQKSDFVWMRDKSVNIPLLIYCEMQHVDMVVRTAALSFNSKITDLIKT